MFIYLSNALCHPFWFAHHRCGEFSLIQNLLIVRCKEILPEVPQLQLTVSYKQSPLTKSLLFSLCIDSIGIWLILTFKLFFWILFFYRSSPRLSNLLCQGYYFVGSALQFYSFTFSHLIPHPFSCYQETHLVSKLVWKVRRHMISKHDTVCLVTLISGFSLN